MYERCPFCGAPLTAAPSSPASCRACRSEEAAITASPWSPPAVPAPRTGPDERLLCRPGDAAPAADEWRRFCHGLLWVRAAVIVGLFGTLVGFVAGLLAINERNAGAWHAAGVIEGVGGFLAAPVMLVGLILLNGVPPRSGLGPLARAALAGFVVLAVCAAASGATGAWYLTALLPPAGLAVQVCLLLLCREAARRLGDAALGGQFLLYLFLTVPPPAVVAVLLLGPFQAALAADPWPSGGATRLLLAVGLGGLAVLGLLLRLLTLLDGLIRLCRRDRRRPPGPQLAGREPGVGLCR